MILISVFNLVLVFLVFLCIGSFLNVVIYRLPKNISLIKPRSYCPICKKKLFWYHNIPLFSFLWLKGRCKFCRSKISSRYILIEIITAITGLILFLRFGQDFNLHFFAASIFSLILIILIFIDLEYQILPDSLTLGLLWLGLLVNTQHIFAAPPEAVIGAAAGYLSLWSIAKVYQYFTHIEGMGYGDFKLLAALGAWVGWEYLLNTVLIASLSGLAIGGYLMLTRKANTRTPLAFGPYLAIAGWIMLLFTH